MVCAAAFRPHMRSPRRGANRTRVLSGFPPRGVARRKAQTDGSAILCRTTAGASRRASRGDLATPARFRRKCPARDRHAVSSSLSVRGDRRRLAWTLRSSASSWQGLLVDPGGARFAAPSAGLRAGPQGHRTPPRLHDASRERPSVDEVMRSVREAREAGISPWAKAGIQFFVVRVAPE
jgi:hypothetical protein